MLRRLKSLEGMKLVATDGDVGSLNDVYFDDETWTVRYLVADTGLWLGRLVLISPIAVGVPDWQTRTILVDLTRKEIENSPDLLSRDRLTREAEADYAAYHGYPFYWGGPDLWGWAGAPGALRGVPPPAYVPSDAPLDVSTASVYSANEIKGYHIHAKDGEIGHIDDFVIDDESWSIRHLQIDTSNWIGGKTVLLATRWVSRVDVADGTVHVDVSKELIASSPEFDPKQPIDTPFEQRLQDHYGLPVYWERDRARARAQGVGRPLS